MLLFKYFFITEFHEITLIQPKYLLFQIVDWSSLDWFKPKGKGGLIVSRMLSQMDSFLSTMFDMTVHMCMMYAIASAYLDVTGVLVAVLVTQAALYIIIFNPKFAWSHPDSMPAWVQRRIGTLALQYD